MASYIKRPVFRSEDYLEFVRSHPCIAPMCTAERSEAHHWHESEKGIGRKPADCFTVPLCHEHHIDWFHRTGKLPKLEHVHVRELFVRTQRRLMAEWLCKGGENTEDSLF